MLVLPMSMAKNIGVIALFPRANGKESIKRIFHDGGFGLGHTVQSVTERLKVVVEDHHLGQAPGTFLRDHDELMAVFCHTAFKDIRTFSALKGFRTHDVLLDV
jgi:hypothetical protein